MFRTLGNRSLLRIFCSWFSLDMLLEMDKNKTILSNTELDKMNAEITNDITLEAYFFKAKAYCYTTVKGEEEKKLKGITKATFKSQIIIPL